MAFLAMALILRACGQVPPEADLEPTMETIVVGGTIELPEGIDVDVSDSSVVSFAETKAGEPDGSFELLTNGATTLQMLFVLLRGACYRGWAAGSMEEAGVSRPAGVRLAHEYDPWNVVPNPGLPLVSGSRESMSHTNASHGSFDRLPAGTVVYTVDSEARTTGADRNTGPVGSW